MLSARNILRCLIATLLALLITAASAHAVPAAANQPQPEEPPDPLATMAAYQAVDRWVRQWRIDDDAQLPIARAAAITLRLDGEILARTTDISRRPEGDAAVTSLALQAALREAESRITLPRDALYEDALRDLARRITISLELAGPFVPFAPKDWAQASLSLEPGIEGVAVRIGEHTAAMFPGTMLATSTEPSSAYAALISRLAEDPTIALNSPADLARDHGVVLYRFAVSHIAQPRASSPPEFLHRGGRIVQRRDLSSAELMRWADALADHLINRPSFGSYDPLRGNYEPDDDAARAIAVLALVQYSELPLASERFLHARRSAARIAAGIDDTPPPAACPALWVALRGMGIGGSPASVATFTDDGPKLRALLAYADACISEAPATDRVLRALSTWARARRGITEARRDPAVDAAIRELFRQTPTPELVSTMPWLGWAELTWSRFEAIPGEPAPVPAAQAFRDMRDLVWQHQLPAADLPAIRRDLAGGIVFTGGAALRNGNVLPTWHAARPLAFIATMLADQRLTDEPEVPAQLARLLASLRFLRQLTAAEPELHMYRTPSHAFGGVRSSPWDQRMSAEATALTLITVTETLRSLDLIESRREERDSPR